MTIVTTANQLNEVCEEIDSSGRFALDMEFIPERTYNPQLCLIQIATESGVHIVDPLRILDLQPFWHRVADEGIQVILHAAEQDLELAYHSSGLVPKNVMDTQIAAGFAGFGYPVGYGKLLNQLLGVSISKTESFTDWMNRPLTESQTRYALDDVCHLLPMFDRLSDLLEKTGRLQWVQEECMRYCSMDYYVRDRSLDYLRVKGASGLSRRALAVLRELCGFRDQEALRLNKPPRSVLSDNILIELSRRPPQHFEDIQRIRGVRIDQVKNYGSALIAAVDHGLKLPGEMCPIWPASKAPPRKEVLVGDILFAALKVICYQLGLAPDLVASRSDLQDLVRAHRTADIVASNLPVLHGWRRQIVGQTLIDLLDGAKLELQIVGENLPVRMLIDPSTKL